MRSYRLLSVVALSLLVITTIRTLIAQTAQSITPTIIATSSRSRARDPSLAVGGFSHDDDFHGHVRRGITKENLPEHSGWIAVGGCMLLFFLYGIFRCFNKIVPILWRDLCDWVSDKWAHFQEERLDRRNRAAARQRSTAIDREIGYVDSDITTLKDRVSTKLAGIKLKISKRDAHAHWRNPGLLEPVGAVTCGNSIHRNESSSYTMHALQRASLRSQDMHRRPEFPERVRLNVINALGEPAQSIREVFKANPHAQSLENQMGAFRTMTAMEFLTQHPYPPKARIASKLREEIDAPTEDQSPISAVNSLVDQAEPSIGTKRADDNHKKTHKRTETQGIMEQIEGMLAQGNDKTQAATGLRRETETPSEDKPNVIAVNTWDRANWGKLEDGQMEGIIKADSMGRPLQRSESQGTMARIEAVAAMGPKDDVANELRKLTETPFEDKPDVTQVNNWGRRSEEILGAGQTEEVKKDDTKYKKRRFSKRLFATVEDEKEECA